MGSGYSVKALVTGEDSIGGLQFEIIPLKQEAVQRYGYMMSTLPYKMPELSAAYFLEGPDIPCVNP